MLNLVTGGAGFIGSRLVNSLVDRGQRVVIIDDMSTGRIRNLEHAVQSGRATLIYADMAMAFGSLRELVARASSEPIARIYHLAPIDPRGMLPLLDLALAHSARFLFAASPSPAGALYERAVMAALSSRNLPSRTVRIFECYGPAVREDDPRLIPGLFRAAFENRPFQIYGSSLVARSPLFVDDAVTLIRLVMERPHAPSQPVDVATDVEYPVEAIARIVARIAGVEFAAEYLPAHEGEPGCKPDLEVARSYGWSPRTSLDRGLRATYAWLSEGRLAFA